MTRLTAQQIENLPEWIPMIEFEGCYEVNCREGIVRNSRTLRVLKLSIDNNGYSRVGLYKDRRDYTKKIHRLVALSAFGYYNIPTDGLDVCHLDETRTNSCIDNLVLGTKAENMNFPLCKKRKSESLKGERNHNFGKPLSTEAKKKLSEGAKQKLSKRVGAYKDDKLIMVFQSIKEAGMKGFNQRHVSSCCTGRRRTHKGYNWKYL